MSRCIFFYNARIQILNKSASFTTKCIMVTIRESENVWLTPALMDDVTELNILKFKSEENFYINAHLFKPQ